MPRETRTRRVTRAQTLAYLGKAEEFLLAEREPRCWLRPRGDQPSSARCDQRVRCDLRRPHGPTCNRLGSCAGN
jgi:hypothetical protein